MLEGGFRLVPFFFLFLSFSVNVGIRYRVYAFRIRGIFFFRSTCSYWSEKFTWIESEMSLRFCEAKKNIFFYVFLYYIGLIYVYKL